MDSPILTRTYAVSHITYIIGNIELPRLPHGITIIYSKYTIGHTCYVSIGSYNSYTQELSINGDVCINHILSRVDITFMNGNDFLPIDDNLYAVIQNKLIIKQSHDADHTEISRHIIVNMNGILSLQDM